MKKIILSISAFLLSAVFYFLYFYPKTASIYYLPFAIALDMVGVVFLVLFILRNSQEKIRMLQDRLEVWNNISYHVNQAGEEAFNKLPIGIIVYDENHNIKWGNDQAKQLFRTRFIDANIKDIQENFAEHILNNEEKFVMIYEDKYYDVIHNKENGLIYLFDETAREKLNIRYDNRILALAIITIDNLDESLREYAVQERSTIRGQFLGELSDYASAYGAYLQSITEDRLLMVTDKESLNKMIYNKFEVLNSMREIGVKNHLRTSVSVGFACYDIASGDLYSRAQSAVDLAEKRGGDQVVVNIEGENVMYFGGKTNAFEKNNMVEAHIQTNILKEIVEGSTNVLVTGHAIPDPDCIGSILGVVKMVQSSNKPVQIVLNINELDSVSKKIIEALKNQDKEIYDLIVSIDEADIKANTLLIVCDTQSPKIMVYPELLDKVSRLCIIDHHRSGDVGFNNPLMSYVETYASSTVELVSEMFAFYNRNIEFKPIEASVMLAGIVVDTNDFTFRSSPRTFDAASILRRLGADMLEVRKFLREDLETEQFIAQSISKVELFDEYFAIAKLDDVIDDRTILAKISDKLLEIDGVQAAFTISKLGGNMVGISARSIDTFNVQMIMEELGGGGHLNAAAVQLADTDIDEITAKLKEIIDREYLETKEDKKMKVILLADVKGRGKKDDVIDVASGYANYLFTNNFAVQATEENLKKLEHQKEQALEDALNHKKLMEKLKEEIEEKSINVYIKLGADGKTFGKVTTKQICDEFESQTGIHLDKKKVKLVSDIDFVGIFNATVELTKDVVATIKINVLEK